MQTNYFKIAALALFAELANANSAWKWIAASESGYPTTPFVLPFKFHPTENPQMWSVVQELGFTGIFDFSLSTTGRVNTTILPEEGGKQYIQVDFTMDGHAHSYEYSPGTCVETSDGATCSKKVEADYSQPVEVQIIDDTWSPTFSVVVNAGKGSSAIGTIYPAVGPVNINPWGYGSLDVSSDTCQNISSIGLDVQLPHGNVGVGEIEEPYQTDKCKENLNARYTKVENGYSISEEAK